MRGVDQDIFCCNCLTALSRPAVSNAASLRIVIFYLHEAFMKRLMTIIATAMLLATLGGCVCAPWFCGPGPGGGGGWGGGGPGGGPR